MRAAVLFAKGPHSMSQSRLGCDAFQWARKPNKLRSSSTCTDSGDGRDAYNIEIITFTVS